MDISKNLVFLRKNLNYTQKNVADKIGMTRAAINKYEKGTRMPSFEVLIKISDYFQVPIQVFSLDDIENIDIQPFRKLSISNLGALLEMYTRIQNKKDIYPKYIIQIKSIIDDKIHDRKFKL